MKAKFDNKGSSTPKYRHSRRDAEVDSPKQK